MNRPHAKCSVRRCHQPPAYSVYIETDKVCIKGDFCMKHCPRVGPKTRFADFRSLYAIPAEAFLAALQ